MAKNTTGLVTAASALQAKLAEASPEERAIVLGMLGASTAEAAETHVQKADAAEPDKGMSERVRAYAMAHPKSTTRQIADAAGTTVANANSVMHRAAKAGLVKRVDGAWSPVKWSPA